VDIDQNENLGSSGMRGLRRPLDGAGHLVDMERFFAAFITFGRHHDQFRVNALRYLAARRAGAADFTGRERRLAIESRRESEGGRSLPHARGAVKKITMPQPAGLD
jgi:hypothetical protein